MEHMPRLSIDILAQRVSLISSEISSYLSTNSFPSPNFTADTTHSPDTPEYEALRGSLNDAALDLLRLVNGPKHTLQQLLFSHYDLAALQIALDNRFFEHIPLSSRARADKSPWKSSVSEISQKANMDSDRTRRVLKTLATQRIFAQVDGSDEFTHTASSALIAQDSGMHAIACMKMEDMLPAASAASAAVRASPHASCIEHSAFSQRYGATIFEYFEQRPEKAERFAKAMSSWSQFDRYARTLHDGFPWAKMGNAKVVDIGGGNGHISEFPSLNFIVQDISPHMLSTQETLDQDIASRLSFKTHDFFTPQPFSSLTFPTIYLLRQCLHNYDDRNAVKILQQIVPALERCSPGTTLLINDVILPENGEIAKFTENYLRRIDMCMMVLMEAKERSEKEWRDLISAADARLRVECVTKNSVGLGLIHVTLDQGVM